MFVSDCLSINEKGNLTIGGCDTVELAKKYGTPLYVFDENQIRQNCRDYVKSIEDNYNGNGLVIYASKAFSCLEMCRICASENMGLDVVSGGELHTALKAGFPAEKIFFHGNNKTKQELELALSNDIGRIIVDNLTELEMLNNLANAQGKIAKIMFRIKPGIDAHTHSFIRTGQIDSKFGFALETGEAMEAIKLAKTMENVELCGVHCHIGSNIFEVEPFELAAKVMVEFIAKIKQETGIEIQELNLGGGFGIKYLSSDEPVAYGDYMGRVAKVVNSTCEKLSVAIPKILIEPGRSIVGSEGITLYTVGNVKEIPDIRTYVAVDGGMTDNPRYIMYQSKYELMCANKAGEPKTKVVTVAGKCCESGDLIQEDTKLQDVETGDTIAVLSTGAYNYSMASNYNRIPRPAAVMVNNGQARVIINRETYDDIITNDV